MKNRICSSLLIFIMISMLATPVNADFHVGTDDVCPGTANSSCRTTCSAYESEVGLAIRAACPSPSPGATDGPINVSDYNTQYPNYNACTAAVTARWGDLGQNCNAMRLSQDSGTWDLTTASVYTVAAAICSTACAFEMASWTPAAIALPYWKAACEVAGGVGLGLDITASIGLTVDGSNYQDWWSGLTAGSETTSVAGNAAGGAALAQKPLGKGISKIGQKIGSKIVHEVGEKMAAKMFGKALSCAAAGLFIATATMKWANYGLNCSTAESSCKNVKDLASFATGVAVGATPSAGPSSGALTSFSSGGSTTSIGSGSSGGGHGGITSVASGIEGDFAGSLQSAATAGPTGMKDFMNQLGGLNDAPQHLNDLGTSVSALASGLRTSSPASVVSGALGSSMPEDLKSAFDTIDQLGKEGKLAASGMTSTISSTPSGSGSVGAAGGSKMSFNPFGSLSRGLAGAAQGGTKEVSFAKQAQALPAADGDIWHTSWNGTIFQIISNKLTKTQDRVDQLEWSTPLNRALMGLKPLPANQTRARGR